MEHAREDALDFNDVRLVAAIQDAMNLARNGFHLRRQNLGHVLRCQQTSFAIRTASRKNCYKPREDRTKAQWLATCSRRTRTASSTHTSSSLHPFEHRSAVTPIRGGLQLRGSKWHRQLKTTKTPRIQTKSQGGGNLATFPGRSPGKAAPLRILAAAFFGCCALTLFLRSRRRWKSFEVRSGPCDPDTPKFDETGTNAKTVPMVPWLNRCLLGACCWAPGPR